MKRSGHKIIEAPVTLAQRRMNRLRFRDGIRTLVDTSAIFYRTYFRRHYDRPAATTPEVARNESKIAVIGCGYVGLVTGACMAEIGHDVVCVDNDIHKITALRNHKLPIFEKGLEEIVRHGSALGKLRFTENLADGISDAQFIFIAVGTPMAASGEADLTQVHSVAKEIGRLLNHEAIVIDKSTVPIETAEIVAATIKKYSPTQRSVPVVSNPEFLREGSAVFDFMHPDRIVIGADNTDIALRVQSLYEPLQARVILTDARTAEMIKYTANAFLATKISFINEISKLCEAVGADVKDVVAGVGSDRRIGEAFMNPGLGFGGSCFPKDVNALMQIAERNNVRSRLLDAVLAINIAQVEFVADLAERALLGGLAGKTIGLLGLSFKPGTDDIRESPAIRLATILIERGAEIRAHDPAAAQKCVGVFDKGMTLFEQVYDVVCGADAVVLATEWDAYRHLDLTALRTRMRGTLFIDGRNCYEPSHVISYGLRYIGVGRRTMVSDSVSLPLVCDREAITAATL